MKNLKNIFVIACMLIAFQATQAQELSANARAELAKNNYLPAIDELTTILANNPNSETVLTYRANFYGRAGQFDKALTDANKVLRINPKSVNAMVVSGIANAGLLKYNDAITNFSGALALQPNLKPALIYRSQAYFMVKDLKKAKADLDLVIQNDPKNMEAYLYRARIYVTQRDFDSAISDYTFINENADPRSQAKEIATAELQKTQELYAKKRDADKLAATQSPPKSLPIKKDDTDDRLTNQAKAMAKELNEANARLKPIMENFSETVNDFSVRSKKIVRSDFIAWSAFNKDLHPKLVAIAKIFEKEIALLNGKENLKALKAKFEEGLPAIYTLIKRTSPYANRYQQYVIEQGKLFATNTSDVLKFYTYLNDKDNANFATAKTALIKSSNLMLDLITTAKKELSKFNDPKFKDEDEEKLTKEYQDYSKTLADIKPINL